jgi:predicted ATPase
LALQRLLGGAFMATKGFGAPETGVAYARARQLCQIAGVSQDIYPVLAGVWLFETTRANHALAKEIAHDILSRAAAANNPEGLLIGHVATAFNDLHVGAPGFGSEDFERAMALQRIHRIDTSGHRYGVDFAASGHAHAAWAEWLLGRPDQALQLSEEALAALDPKKHIFTGSRGLYWNAVLRQFRGEWPIVRDRAKMARKLAKEHGFAMVVAVSRVMEGAARAALGETEAGILELRTALDAYRATGARFQRPYHLVLLAEALRRAGKVEESLAVLADAAALMDETGERFYQAEGHRLHAALLLARDGGRKAEAIRCLQAALDIARTQRARSLELLAARDLAALWADTGERGKAHDLLASVYAGFTEGFDTPAVASSRQLLDALG